MQLQGIGQEGGNGPRVAAGTTGDLPGAGLRGAGLFSMGGKISA